jgi:hypothetical protein
VGITLSPSELRDLTGYKRPADQLRELHRLGFFRARRGRVTGEVILERAHVDAVAAGTVASQADEQRNRPRLRAVT